MSQMNEGAADAVVNDGSAAVENTATTTENTAEAPAEGNRMNVSPQNNQRR